MQVVMEKGQRYQLQLASGELIEGLAAFYRASTTPKDKPIVLETKEGKMQIDSDMVITCKEIVRLVD